MLCKGLGTPDGSSAILGPSSGSSAATFSLNTSSVIGKRVSLMNIPNRDFIRGKRSKPIGPLTHGFPSHLDDPSKKMRSPASRQTFVNLAMHGSSMSVSTASISARFEMRGPHHRPICSRVARASALVRLCSFARRSGHQQIASSTREMSILNDLSPFSIFRRNKGWAYFY